MRFFFELVSCIGPSNKTTKSPPRAEDTTKLVLRKQRRRKRAYVPSSSAVHEAEWKPSLTAISEDKVVVMMEKEKDENQTERAERLVVKRKSSSSCEQKVHVRRYGEDFGQGPVPIVIPAFSPTPFLF